MKEIRSYYEDQTAKFQEEYQKIHKTYNLVAYLRLVVFLAGIIIVYFIYPYSTILGLGLGILFLSLFLFLIKRHNQLADKRKLIRYLQIINEQELTALEGDYSKFQSGEEFIDSTHDYSYDLDVFGDFSLYQYINRTVTYHGRKQLAEALMYPTLNYKDIETRQRAVRDLVYNLEWAQYFQALGMGHSETKEDLDQLFLWLKEPHIYYGSTKWQWIMWGIPAAFICSFLGYFLQFIPGIGFSIPIQIPSLLFLLQLGIAGMRMKYTNPIHAQVGKKSGILAKYSSLFSYVESFKSENTYIYSLQKKLYHQDTPSSYIIDKLGNISLQFDQRLNSIVAIMLNGMFLSDIRVVWKLEKWKHMYGNHVEEWFQTMGTFDMLLSLSRIANNNPAFCWPEIIHNEFIIEGKALGHPLVESSTRIDNDIVLKQSGTFWLVTGANMAGKSTFLRAIGVNIILAIAGAPVCARELKISPMPLLTSMRTTDSLASNTSYFLAELNILKHIINRLETQSPAFVMIDEMLRGTNSRDKQTGSRKFVERLMAMGGMGLVATHDLSLGTLADEYPENIFNKCFEIQIDGDQLQFDYKLRDGISQNLNATFLMEQMGIMG